MTSYQFRWTSCVTLFKRFPWGFCLRSWQPAVTPISLFCHFNWSWREHWIQLSRCVFWWNNEVYQLNKHCSLCKVHPGLCHLTLKVFPFSFFFTLAVREIHTTYDQRLVQHWQNASSRSFPRFQFNVARVKLCSQCGLVSVFLLNSLDNLTPEHYIYFLIWRF